MTSPAAYYAANRILWAVALLVGPIAGGGRPGEVSQRGAVTTM
jgi:hypothetical protein